MIKTTRVWDNIRQPSDIQLIKKKQGIRKVNIYVSQA